MWIECEGCEGDGTGCSDPQCLCACSDCGGYGGTEIPDTADEDDFSEGDW